MGLGGKYRVYQRAPGAFYVSYTCTRMVDGISVLVPEARRLGFDSEAKAVAAAKNLNFTYAQRSDDAQS